MPKNGTGRDSAGINPFASESLPLEKTLAKLYGSIMSRASLISKKCDMSHLSPSTDGPFSIQMQMRPGKVQQGATFGVGLDRLGIRSDEIDHGGGT